MNRKSISFRQAIKGVSASARKKAFRQNQPVAISVNGKTYLLYADGSRKLFTEDILQELKHAKS